jgi:DNA-binding NarL/FixJ family response regulator
MPDIAATPITPVTPTVRLVLADDHPLMLQALMALVTNETNLRVVATASDGELALEAVRRFKPDMLVLDVRMVYMDGMTCLQKIRAEGLPVRVLMLSGLEDEHTVRAMMDVGADGVTLKSDSPQVTLSAIQQVAAGHMALPQSARRYLFAPPADAQPTANALTEREAELLALIARGQSNVQMAEALRLSENTVKFHLRNIFAKLGVANRTEAAAKFHRRA